MTHKVKVSFATRTHWILFRALRVSQQHSKGTDPEELILLGTPDATPQEIALVLPRVRNFLQGGSGDLASKYYNSYPKERSTLPWRAGGGRRVIRKSSPFGG